MTNKNHCKRCGGFSGHYRFCEDVTRLEAGLAAANKLRHDLILYSDKALTEARDIQQDLREELKESWAQTVAALEAVAWYEDNMQHSEPNAEDEREMNAYIQLQLARQQETTNDH